MPPLRIVGISASYRAGGRADWQLSEVDLEVDAAQVVAVLGPNGAGKTTLLRVVAGLLAPLEGRVELAGQELARMDRRAVARSLALVPQRDEMAEGFTVREVVAMGRAPHQSAWLRTRREDEQVVEEALRVSDLQPLADRLLSSLSGGEQKRTHIARALAQQAPVLLLDEASAHLDIRHAVEIHAMLRNEVRARRIACLAVMHDLNAAARFADRVVLLSKGRVVTEGPVAEVMTAEWLSQVFGTAIHVGRPAPDGRPTFLAMGDGSPSGALRHGLG